MRPLYHFKSFSTATKLKPNPISPSISAPKHKLNPTTQSSQTLIENQVSFYRRELPQHLTSLLSAKGKLYFKESLLEKNAENYFPLVVCGPGSLAMCLNALEVDPGKTWKGVWRWYSDHNLECVASDLDSIKNKGITFNEFSCLARCNGLLVEAKRPQQIKYEEFVSDIQKVCSSDQMQMVVNFSRKTLSQTGDGHFSPIGSLNWKRRQVLILDTARFKYPSFYCSIDLLWEALHPIDKETGQSRGYFLLSKDERGISHTFDSCYFKKLKEPIDKYPNLSEILNKEPMTIYTGFDPTASSLHVGNLLALMTLIRFYKAGHSVIALVGGATGAIGDPSGKSSERKALDFQIVQENAKKISVQIENIFRQVNMDQHKNQKLLILNNYYWLKQMDLLTFLRDVGKHVKLTDMMSRESVSSRLQRQQSISFTEFTYQLLQAYDFYHLYKNHQCRLQIGGSDQWGNIVSGMEYIQKREPDSQSVYGLTLPLLLAPNGEKFGKSAGNAVWLDSKMTSCFDFFQFFMKTSDEQLPSLFNYFTFKTVDEIQDILHKHEKDPSEHFGQMELAKSVLEIVHGKEAVTRVLNATQILFHHNYNHLKASEIVDAFQDDQQRLLKMNRTDLPLDLISLCLKLNLFQSRGQAKKMIQNGGLNLNEQRATSPQQMIDLKDFKEEQVMILRIGKSSHYIVQLQ